PPNRNCSSDPGHRSSTSRQRSRAPLPNLLLRKPILLPLPALVFRTRALPTKPSRQDKRPQQEQSRRHATRFRSRVPGCARSWCCRRGHEIIWLPRMTRASKRVKGRPPPAEAASIQPRGELEAQKLLNWLQHWAKNTITMRDICVFGPNSLRDKKSAIRSAEVLVHHGWLIPNRSHRYDQRVWRIARKPILGPTVAAETADLGPQTHPTVAIER